MMPRVRRRNTYQHVPDFDRGRITIYQDCGLSYSSIAALIGLDPMFRVWNGWIKEDHMEHHTRSQRPAITNS